MQMDPELLHAIAEALKHAGPLPTCNHITIHVEHSGLTLNFSAPDGWSFQRTLKHQQEIPQAIAQAAASLADALDKE